MAQHNDLGRKGEEIACQHLVNSGYTILHRNWVYNRGEIDIAARTGNFLVIVEVKSRSLHDHTSTDDMISERKLRILYETSDHYISVYNLELEVRYDLIVVVFNGGNYTLEHIPEAFYPFMNR